MPVIWHDNYVVYGDAAAPTSRLISDLTLAQFRQLAPVLEQGGVGAGGGGDAGMEDSGADTPFGGSPLGGSPASSTFSLSSLDSLGPPASTASSSRARLLRKHKNGEPAVAGEPTLRPWRCEQEDHFPTLAEVRRKGGGAAWEALPGSPRMPAAACLSGPPPLHPSTHPSLSCAGVCCHPPQRGIRH